MPRRKASSKAPTQPPPAPPTVARAMVANSMIKSGRLEVAIAIAKTSHLVSVDPTVTPFTTIPPNLFDLIFKDNKVGIDDNQMAVFKAQLAALLPEITSDINQIPENSNQVIEDVAFFVKLALFAA